MQMQELARFGIPEEVVKLWEREEGESLLPLQELAVKRYGLFGDENLLVQAPTSSGKTFIGEMAAIQTTLRRKKVVYLAPLKALAEEKYRDFKKKYAPYGVRVVISTRDHREHDRDVEEGRFSVAVVVYEKLAQLLVRRPERMAEIDLVIADELELLSDPERGAMTELLMTRLLQSDCRIIGLSAVIGHADKLAKWMRAQLVYYERRPTELRYGVLCDGKFRYRTYNDFGQGEEALVDADSESPWEVLTQNLAAFVERGESCLVFVKAKHESRRGAALLAGRLELPAATQAIESLHALEATRSRDALIHSLGHGVAFHNADLSPEERAIVEQAFRSGEALAMVSTGTLAVGMNLPAMNVFISPEKWRYDERLDVPWKTPLLHHEYENMSGRAGRYGGGMAFGRSLLIAASPFDFEALWRRYIDGEREPIEPRLANVPLDGHVLRLIASRHCRTEKSLTTFLESTLTGKWIWLEQYTRDEISFRVRAALNRCIEVGMAVEDAAGNLQATPLGMVVASKGIGLETARLLAHWIERSDRRPWHPLDLILASALTPDGRLLQVMLTSREYEQGGYLGRLKRAASELALDADTGTPLCRLRRAVATPFFDEVRAIKGALFLTAWIDDMPMQEIEEEFQTMAGQVLAAAEQTSWLVDAASALAAAVGGSSQIITQLEELSQRLRHGVTSGLLPLASAGIEGLTRNSLLRLQDEGMLDPALLAVAPDSLLEHWLTPESARAVQRWAGRQVGEVNREAPAPLTQRAVSASRVLLILDESLPGEVILGGQRILLQDKQFRLLRALAERPGQCVNYDTVYKALWGNSIVESGQLYSQKRNLVKRLASAKVIGKSELIATRPKHGFMLQLDPGQVLIKTRQQVTVAA